MKALERPTANLIGVQVIGALGMAILSIAAVMSWRAGDGAVALLFLALAVLAFYLVLGSGQVAADSSVVTVSSVLGHYQLAWQDVHKVEASAHGTLVLHGQDARLVVPPPLFWSGPHKQALRAQLATQFRERSLIVQRSWTADFTTHKNVRIKRAGSG
ncbi:MAG: hypothetical protein LH470_00055 [Lysobacter sp.]|nr:hypothetical protein [Lysobacter sp.]